MRDNSLFKKQVEQLCGIGVWNPTDRQLAEIARRFALSPPKNKAEAHAIVVDVCPDSQFMVMEGVDNSDLHTLLMLAIAAAKG